ncbi:MAG: response regulator transcription factor [Oleispira sp.]|nr:response regulator transcription factor [Oleispira sp.]
MQDNKWKILLVEDDLELAQLIQDYLSCYEFIVEVVHDGSQAVSRISNEQPDLVILDLMLPGKDGISICKEVRADYSKIIIMLTASRESIDHILGLEIGADEFIHKPVEPRVLLAHVRALIRRQQIPQKSIEIVKAQLGNLEINTSDRLVKVDGIIVDLLNNEYELLLLLFKNIGKIITRDDIFKRLKGIEYDGASRFSDILISQLRNKLSIDGISDNHIKTVRNKGYILVEEF